MINPIVVYLVGLFLFCLVLKLFSDNQQNKERDQKFKDTMDENKSLKERINEQDKKISTMEKENEQINGEYHKISTQYLVDGSKDFLQKISYEKTIKAQEERLRPFENNKFIFQIKTNKRKIFSINAFPVKKLSGKSVESQESQRRVSALSVFSCLFLTFPGSSLHG